MGHERVGVLPRTKRWAAVVDGIAAAAELDGDVRDLADATLRNVRAQLRNAPGDGGIVAAFQFLLALSLSASSGAGAIALGDLAIDLAENPSPLKLSVALDRHILANRQSVEYAELARKAAVDVITQWTAQHTQQLSLMGDREHAKETWRRASDGRGFCEVARLFFAKFVERYLNYFIGREASSRLTNIEARERLAARLQQHVDGISRHAFETAQITQSFAAGWFNRHAAEGMPPTEAIRRFVAHSMSKLQEELLREEAPR